jgi:hypothetical protein
VFSRFNRTIIATIFAAALASVAAAQATPQPTPAVLETPKPAAKPVDLTPLLTKQGSAQTAEQVAEAAVFFYGFPGFITNPMGRDRLNQIRKTTLEKGKIVVTSADGKTEQANYQRFIVRGENQAKEKIRLEQDFPSAKYSLVFKDEKIYGIYNNTVFTPREDATRSFENQMFHGLEALLRYKENGSDIALQPKEKILGVEYYVLDVTDKQQRKTRFYISTKSFHVMMLTYDDAGVTYKRKFYDYNQAQGTLVPYRTVLWAGDKQIEETEVGTITFGQKVDDGLFSQG